MNELQTEARKPAVSCCAKPESFAPPRGIRSGAIRIRGLPAHGSGKAGVSGLTPEVSRRRRIILPFSRLHNLVRNFSSRTCRAVVVELAAFSRSKGIASASMGGANMQHGGLV